MKIDSHFQVRGVPGEVATTFFGERRVDFWAPAKGASHLIVTHDGQNIFDRRTATRKKTWELAQTAIRVSEEFGVTPPVIIAVHHSTTKENPFGRWKELAPEQPYKNGVKPIGEQLFGINELTGDSYQALIADEIIPAISGYINFSPTQTKSALLGSSMGGLASLYGVGLRPELFGTALAFSPHWVIGENPLVDALLEALPKPGSHKIWMSRGTKALDGQYEPFQNYADQKMGQLGWRLGHDSATHVYPRTGHNEKSWAKYLHEALRFWLSE